MSEASTPKNWWEAWSSHIVWGGLVFTCFFVFIEKLVERDWGSALAALLLGLGIAAVALHSKAWLERTNPNWACAGALALVLALILSPFIEEKRWPFSAWFPATPSETDIAKAVQKATDPIRAQLALAWKERDQAQARVKELENPPQQLTLGNLLTSDKQNTIQFDPNLFAQSTPNPWQLGKPLWDTTNTLTSILPSKEQELQSALDSKNKEIETVTKERDAALLEAKKLRAPSVQPSPTTGPIAWKSSRRAWRRRTSSSPSPRCRSTGRTRW